MHVFGVRRPSVQLDWLIGELLVASDGLLLICYHMLHYMNLRIKSMHISWLLFGDQRSSSLPSFVQSHL